MHQSGRRLGLHTEFRDKIRIVRKLLLQHLNGYGSVQFMVLRSVYNGHTAGSCFLKDLIAIRDQHADLHHTAISCQANASIRMIEMLSVPPFRLAAATSAFAFDSNVPFS